MWPSHIIVRNIRQIISPAPKWEPGEGLSGLTQFSRNVFVFAFGWRQKYPYTYPWIWVNFPAIQGELAADKGTVLGSWFSWELVIKELGPIKVTVPWKSLFNFSCLRWSINIFLAFTHKNMEQSKQCRPEVNQIWNKGVYLHYEKTAGTLFVDGRLIYSGDHLEYIKIITSGKAL